jgi:chemotaxis methyl-accepting protein methylase
MTVSANAAVTSANFSIIKIKVVKKLLRIYVSNAGWFWSRLPYSVQRMSASRAYARHLNRLVLQHSIRKQQFSTFFLRNRPELRQLCHLINQKPPGAHYNLLILACSKGAEVYSMAWAIRTSRPDLNPSITAVDISQEILDFAARGIYSLNSSDATDPVDDEAAKKRGDISWNTSRGQNASIFERMSREEIDAMFEVQGDQASVRSWLRQGIIWLRGDANDSGLRAKLGPQEIVVANRFLCHMAPAVARRCLLNIAQLVRPGGYLFVSGVDLDLRTQVAVEMGWKPVGEMIREIHNGDVSIRCGWPLEYWGLEPLDDRRADWQIRYASVFQIAGGAGNVYEYPADEPRRLDDVG